MDEPITAKAAAVAQQLFARAKQPLAKMKLDELQSLLADCNKYEKSAYQHIDVTLKGKKIQQDELIKILDPVLDLKVSVEAAVIEMTGETEVLPSVSKLPTHKEDKKQNELPIIENLDFTGMLSETEEQVKPTSLSDLRKHALVVMYRDPGKIREGEWSFRIYKDSEPGTWTALPPPMVPLGPEFIRFRLFPLFYELAEKGYCRVGYFYNLHRKVVGGYRHIVELGKAKEEKVIKLLKKLASQYFIHLNQPDYISHLEFFRDLRDTEVWCSYTYNEKTKTVVCTLGSKIVFEQKINN